MAVKGSNFKFAINVLELLSRWMYCSRWRVKKSRGFVEMFKEILENVRKTCPLIHNITNYVSINDCANILLACGASPIMADAPEEAEEITALCGGLNMNMGMLQPWKRSAMLLAGKKANELGRPVVLDPVGVGASAFRMETARELLDQIRFTVIRGNLSEIRALALGGATSRGVDAEFSEALSEDTLDQTAAFARDFSAKTGAVIVMTGAIDLVADSGKACAVYNGHPMMRSVTGVGCQLSALTAAFVTANSDTVTEASAAAVCAMGLCGEKAWKRMGPEDGSGSYRVYMMDAVSRLTGEELERNARYRML